MQQANDTTSLTTDLCVIGAGSAGLSIAAGAVNMGARVILLEKNLMGGDCLNTGCVPSKALLAAARRVHDIKHAKAFGIQTSDPVIMWEGVRKHVDNAIATIAPNDSVERFERMGVQVIQEAGAFIDPKTVATKSYRIKAKYFIIATGSYPKVPPIPGLDQVDYLTNETIFKLDVLPKHIVIIGAGPIGCEMAQAFARLTAKVTLISNAEILNNDDREASAVVQASLEKDGVTILTHRDVLQIHKEGDNIKLDLQSRQNAKQTISASHLLIATGRAASIDGLGLDHANVCIENNAIKTDNRLRTSNRCIFAAGDVTGPPQFTHLSSYHAGILIRNLLFRIPAKVSLKSLPWVTYTDPELAHVGMNEANAIAIFGKSNITSLQTPFGDNDRAIAENDTHGFIKVICRKNGQVLGVTIVGNHAGELLGPWFDVVANAGKVASVASSIFPYPTLSEISKRVAGSYYTPKLFSQKTKKIVRLLLKLP